MIGDAMTSKPPFSPKSVSQMRRNQTQLFGPLTSTLNHYAQNVTGPLIEAVEVGLRSAFNRVFRRFDTLETRVDLLETRVGELEAEAHNHGQQKQP